MVRAPRSALVVALAALAACQDRDPLLPEIPPPATHLQGQVVCSVTVATATLACERINPSPSKASGALFDKIVGGQDVYVKLTSQGVSYNAGTGIFQADVRLQNLMRQAIGTQDGHSVDGVRIFFNTEPTVTSGTGTVTVANADGVGVFTANNQAYFLYSAILPPNVISEAKTWQFHVAPTVLTFQFTVYVSAPMPDELGALLQSVWTGGSSGDWSLAANWRDGIVPDTASAVVVFSDSLFSGSMPVLAEDVAVTHLRVGSGSTLDLAGHTLTAHGNVDAVGTLITGTLRMSGAGVVLQGNVHALQVRGSVSLQGAARATGAVSVTDGSLTTSGYPLTITIP